MHELLRRIRPIAIVADVESEGTRNIIASVELNRKLMSCEIIASDDGYIVKLIDASFHRDGEGLYAITDWRYIDTEEDPSGPTVSATWVKGKNVIVGISPRDISSRSDDMLGCELYPTLRIPLTLVITGDEFKLCYMGANTISNFEDEAEGLGEKIKEHKENLVDILVATLNYICDSASSDDVTSISENIANEI